MRAPREAHQLQARKRALTRDQPCQHPDLWRPASRSMRNKPPTSWGHTRPSYSGPAARANVDDCHLASRSPRPRYKLRLDRSGENPNGPQTPLICQNAASKHHSCGSLGTWLRARSSKSQAGPAFGAGLAPGWRPECHWGFSALAGPVPTSPPALLDLGDRCPASPMRHLLPRSLGHPGLCSESWG